MPERIAFGKLVRQWFARNGWPQDVPHRLAKITGAAGPWNSQVSQIMQGKLDPKPALFVAFGAFNQAVAEQRFPGVTERRLLDQLTGSEPLRHDDGRPYTAPDFFALFTGLLDAPSSFSIPERVITEEDAQGISQMCRDEFRMIAKDKLLSPAEAWSALRPHCEGMSAAQVDRFKDVLSGWGDWSVDEVTELSVAGELGKPAAALQRWNGGIVVGPNATPGVA
jgi:hypothetical protein